jgi:hypothetical protein
MPKPTLALLCTVVALVLSLVWGLGHLIGMTVNAATILPWVLVFFIAGHLPW